MVYKAGNRLASTEDTEKLKQDLEEFVMYGTGDLVIDMKYCRIITSVGLRIFFKTYRSLKEQNREFKLINVPDIIVEIFDVTGFLNTFNVE